MAAGGTGGRKATGKCKWFNVLKGFGYITTHDDAQEVFVHQTVIQMPGFRSLGEGEEVELEYRQSDKGMEATMVCGPGGTDCKGSDHRPLGKKKWKKIRCYNCGEFGSHLAGSCPHGPLPKRCHHCKSEDHLIADCPKRKDQPQPGTSEYTGSEEESFSSPSAKADEEDTSRRSRQEGRPSSSSSS